MIQGGGNSKENKMLGVTIVSGIIAIVGVCIVFLRGAIQWKLKKRTQSLDFFFMSDADPTKLSHFLKYEVDRKLFCLRRYYITYRGPGNNTDSTRKDHPFPIVQPLKGNLK